MKGKGKGCIIQVIIGDDRPALKNVLEAIKGFIEKKRIEESKAEFKWNCAGEFMKVGFDFFDNKSPEKKLSHGIKITISEDGSLLLEDTLTGIDSSDLGHLAPNCHDFLEQLESFLAFSEERAI